ncbi:MAG: glycogen debranching enzyme family protein [Deltaproteobacteria bacterium]|nr:glycogen debranching enzyme family protein [Deltaproteobacteria bacterium]
MSISVPPSAEWLETDGLGGFASGTVGLVRTRRYHALLLAATTPPAGRVVMVNGLEVWLETPDGTVALSSQRYAPDVVHPDGAARVAAFTPDPWPRWTFALPGGATLEHGLFLRSERAAIDLYWQPAAGARGTLCIRPLLSGRDYHALHHENPGFRFDAERDGDRVVWCPYPGLPAIVARSNGTYAHDPEWYRRFLYTEERDRGLDDVEDLASPGVFRCDLAAGTAVLTLAAAPDGTSPSSMAEAGDPSVSEFARRRVAEERRRASFPSRLHRAADAYVVRRGAGRTIIAGYPWFTDWGRDTFIALRGLCLATGRLDDTRQILLEWAGAVSEGMLPNRFPDDGGTPEFNAVDAALWYVVAVHEFLETARTIDARERATLEAAIDAIVAGYVRGTRHCIAVDADGLLAAGEPGVQLTWMDAKIGDWVVTPRIGKPVEVQALWLNALRIASRRTPMWDALYTRGRAAFEARFWDESRGCLHDVVDSNHERGAVDPSFRPNQILAIGGLPFPLLDRARARRIVDAVEAHLLTPMGLRSLAPDEPGYAPHYAGGVRERDSAYHQGTVWPWLMGPFAEAWVRVRGNSQGARREARVRFLAPLLAYAETHGLGHLPEVADAEPPHHAGGCPCQAWSVGEALRLSRILDDADAPRPGAREGAAPIDDR